MSPSSSPEGEDNHPNEAYSTRQKRSHSEAMDYPRRRATIACQICRLRKTRCNGARPKCQLCVDLSADCIYREPGIKLDAGDRLILDQLSRIEGLLHSTLSSPTQQLPLQQTQLQLQLQPHSQALSSTSPSTTLSIDTPEEPNPTTTKTSKITMSSVGMTSWTHPPTLSISTMPKVHTTPALTLLHWPLIRTLISQPTNPQILLQLELSRPPLPLPFPLPALNSQSQPQSQSQQIDLTNAPLHAKTFFKSANKWYALVNPRTWPRYYQAALTSNFKSQTSCLVLLVLSLGAASTHGSISQLHPGPSPSPGPSTTTKNKPPIAIPGTQYFNLARTLLPSLMLSNTVRAAQCMVLASAYLFYLVRPLEAWTMLSSASTKLQLLFATQIPRPWKELSVRVYWNALLFESDLLAELDLPHSGLVSFEEVVELPLGFEVGDEDGVEFQQQQQHHQQQHHQQQAQGQGQNPEDAYPEAYADPGLAGLGPIPEDSETSEYLQDSDELWYFLAEIALRRLLNRVSHLIYNQENGHTVSISELGPVVSELDFQLSQWYENLPDPIRFPLQVQQVPEEVAYTSSTTTNTHTHTHTHTHTTNVDVNASVNASVNADPDPDPNPNKSIQTVLRHRYNACKTIIYRPYILSAITNPNVLEDAEIRARCQRCLSATLHQLRDITSHRAGHLPYLWQGALSMVSQTLLVMGASLSPGLVGLLPDASVVDGIIGRVLDEVEGYARLAPSLGVSAGILREAEGRRRGRGRV